jgi:iron complex transport system substrate-binding protein
VRALVLALLVASCGAAASPPRPAPTAPKVPERIVSLDYCADQFVLGLADRDQIAALSPHAEDDYAYFREAAAGLPQVAPNLEEVLALKPDLVVRTYGGGLAMGDQLHRLGVPVLELGFAETFEGIAQTTAAAGAALGQPARGEALAADLRRRLATPSAPSDLSALYVTPGGATAGQGTLIDQVFAAAGYRNAVAGPGWPDLPLEAIAADPPDVVVTAFYGSAFGGLNTWSEAQHPLITNLLRTRPVIALDAAQVSCGGWFVADAADALRAGQGP